ncbi:NAD(P)H-binding protein [Marinilabiliaceae bacterium ANBcel2]|nr:NAD(P)H-binding protein [Marinilabiliaceae bacterium ANBcel2]
MKILLTGANGYIGKKLLPALLEDGHKVVCVVRNRSKLPFTGIYSHHNVSIVELDFLKDDEVSYDVKEQINDIDAAYYLIHSLTLNTKTFDKSEKETAYNFLKIVEQTSAKHIIYLGAIANEEQLSMHLASRKKVEEILKSGSIPFTALKAGIIVGCGSASFEIIRTLIEKFPLIVGPEWLNTPSQPVSVVNVIQYLKLVLLRSDCFNESYDLGGPRVLSYKEMLKRYARVRRLKRYIYTMPFVPPQLASLFISLITGKSYCLALNLIKSMKIPIVARQNNLDEKLGVKRLSYNEAVTRCCGL